MDRSALHATLVAAQARLVADRAGALAAAGLHSGLAYLALPLLRQLGAHDDQDEVGDLLRDLVGAEQRRALRQALDGDMDAALRALDGESPLGKACVTLLEALDQAEDHTALHTQLGITTGARSTVVNPRMYAAGRDLHVHEAPPDPALEHRERALLAYLRRTRVECNALPLSQLDPTDAEQRPMELARVYIGLHTNSQVPMDIRDLARSRERSPAGRAIKTRPLTVIEALGQPGQSRLMLLGAPGSGKSTFVSHLALCLAGAALCTRKADEPQPPGGWMACLPGWRFDALLPVQIILRDFAAYPPLAAALRGTLRLLLDFLSTTLADARCADALPVLEAALNDGQAILLLDGLDEVVGTPVLERVVESIADAARSYTRSPMLVTCRILDYQGERLRQIPGFTVQTLADLTDEQIGQFVTDWYAELSASGRRSPAQARDDTRVLQQAIGARAELRDLTRLPLLLTVMALVHTNKGTLPDARALLYAECVELLLLRWRQPRGERDLLARLGLSQFRSSDLLALMARLGFAAHEVAERTLTPDPRPADLSEREVIGFLAEGFASYDAARKHALAELVLNELERGNGLLLQRGPDRYAFPHRTFQEFLAGYHLKSQRDYRKLCLARSPQAHWHEVLSLMVGYQVLADRELEKPLELAERLLARSSAERALAGELLNLIGRERAAQYDPALIQPEGLWPRAQSTLLELATAGRAPDAPTSLRARAGKALGTLCYGTLDTLCQPGLPVPLPDRRLPLAVIGLVAQQEDWWQPSLDAYWCPVEAGPFWYGDDTAVGAVREPPLQQIALPYAYQIARYPVTNAEYARFVAASGYDLAQPWWTEQGRVFLLPGGHRYDDQSQPIMLPRYWDDSDLNNPLQPVVGVSWYEAAAYCAWLTGQAHAAGWLPIHNVLRLPTSLEWERAARHTDQRRYPWGDEPPDAERANYDKTGLGAPSPVGCFPAGAAACGVLDMVGNVMEWMATLEYEPQALVPQKDFTPEQGVLLAYNDFRDGEGHLCCGVWDWLYPSDWYFVGGFRIIWSLGAQE